MFEEIEIYLYTKMLEKNAIKTLKCEIDTFVFTLLFFETTHFITLSFTLIHYK